MVMGEGPRMTQRAPASNNTEEKPPRVRKPPITLNLHGGLKRLTRLSVDNPCRSPCMLNRGPA